MSTIATPSSSELFTKRLIECLHAVALQEENRFKPANATKRLEDYFPNRRHNIGCPVSYVFGRYQMDIPDEAFYHPVIQELENMASDMVILDNVRQTVLSANV